MHLPALLASATLLLGTTQGLLIQCAVQGYGGYDVAKTHEYTSEACSAAGGSLGSTPGDGRAGGIACCTLSDASKGKFQGVCKEHSDIPIGTPQPC